MRTGSFAVTFTLLLAAAGCKSQPQPRATPPPPVAECALLTADSVAGSSEAVHVALLDEVSPASAPLGRNDSERLLFRHAYEALIDVDCRGRVRPALAESWDSEANGRGWRFTIREDARFWDGRRLTAVDVVRGWESGPGWVAVDSITIDSDRTFTVHLGRAHDTVPILFADPSHAVALSQAQSTWPLGTGPYRIEGPAPSTDFSHLVVNAYPPERGSQPRVVFRLATLTDARDLIDGGIDVMVTAAPDVLDYASKRSELESLPLPWDRTYVLLSPTRVRELRARQDDGLELPSVSGDLRDALASDAVRGDARGHQGSGWWDGDSACEVELERLRALPPAVATAAYRVEGPRRVVYIEGDEVARGLAERVVALATRPVSVERSPELNDAVPGLGEADVPLLVSALDRDRFDSALQRGSEFLFVVALATQSLDPCHHTMLLAERAPWLNIGWLSPVSTIIPLVDTRQHVIARSGAVSLTLAVDGTVLIP